MTTQTAADEAVAYLLQRIKSDARLAYYFDFTESLSKLTNAYAEANGLNVDDFRREYSAQLRGETPLCSQCRREI